MKKLLSIAKVTNTHIYGKVIKVTIRLYVFCFLIRMIVCCYMFLMYTTLVYGTGHTQFSFKFCKIFIQ